MRNFSALCTVSLLVSCSPLTTPPPPAEVTHEVQLRFVNLGREAVTVTLEGETAGHQVQPWQSLAKTGHVTLIKQRGTVAARDFLVDGSKPAVELPFEFDTTTGEPVTFLIKDLTPDEPSMKVSIAKQTQGATFGEKVSAGLAGVELDGGVDTDGDCLADFGAPAGTMARVGLHGDPVNADADCVGSDERQFVQPAEADVEATPYFVRGKNGELKVAWVGRVQAGLHAAGGAISQGASLLGGALPGGAVISAAVSSLYVLNASGNGLPATVSIEGIEVARLVAPGALVRVKTSAVAAALRKAASEQRSTLASISVGAVTGTVDLAIGDDDTLLVVSENLTSPSTVLKTKHDTAKNSVNNVRLQIVLGTTSSLETTGCVAVLPTDDTCVMGAARLGGAGGGAAQASYASTGLQLYPPSTSPAQGSTMRFGVEELGVVARRFVWANPAGLTPVADKAPGGFALVARGTVLDANAVDQRALLFVDTTTSPWTVKSSLSR